MPDQIDQLLQQRIAFVGAEQRPERPFGARIGEELPGESGNLGAARKTGVVNLARRSAAI